ncbi:MAG TPA: MFS transporter [Crenotrichaceae bacterium]|nr:MFS transporter [Crenotrichaceae bacterium]
MRTKKIVPWVMWGISTLYFFFDFINQVIPAALGTQLRAAFHVDASTFGLISSCYFYSYAILQIPVGLTVDRFGPRRPLAAAALIAGTGCLLFSMASSPVIAAITRMVVGAGAAFSFVSCLKLAANWFPANRFATIVGLTNVVGMLGAVSGEGPISKLGESLGWRETIWLVAAFGLSLALIIFLFVRDQPEPTINRGSSTLSSHILTDLSYLLSQRDAWFAGIYAATINTSFIAFGALWGTLFIQARFQISQAHAAAMVSILFIGAIPGSFFFGWFADRIQGFKLPMAIGASGGLMSMALLLYVPDLSVWIVDGLLFLLGFFCSSNVLAYASNARTGALDAEGTSLGFTNTWLIGGSALFQPLIGWLLQQNPSVQQQESIHHLSLADFQIPLTTIVISLFIALIMSLLIKDRYHIHTLADQS